MVIDMNMMKYDEHDFTWISTLGTIDSNQHDLPVGKCNVIENYPLEMPMLSLPKFPADGFEASTTDVSWQRLCFGVLVII